MLRRGVGVVEVTMRVMRVMSFLAVGCMAASSVLGQAPRLPLPGISGPPAAMPSAGAAPAPTPTQYVDPWEALQERMMKIQKVKKSQAVRVSKEYAKPNAVTPWKMRIVDEDAEYLYLQNLPVENPESPLHTAWLQHEIAEQQLSEIQENENRYFILDPFAPIVPPPFTHRLTLTEHSDGLPKEGKWQMGFAVADMNHDGMDDLVFPPPRLGNGQPVVFLQTENGWQRWDKVQWPNVKLDYGAAGVADFDGDGNLDIAIACHFMKNYILYGDGKGNFTRYVELPRVNPNVSSRALAVADFDGDGRPDVAFLAELDMEMGTSAALTQGLVQVCLNTSSGWRAVDASAGRPDIFGDQLAVGDYNGDGKPDLLISSNKNTNRYYLFLNNGGAQPWTPVALDQFPYHAYVLAVATAKAPGAAPDQAVLAFMQRIQSGKESFTRNAIAVYTFTSGPEGLAFKDRRIADIDDADYAQYTCATAADLDGDGLTDLAVGRQNGQVRVFLQTEDTTYLEEKGAEISLGNVWVNAIHAIRLGKPGSGRTALVVTSSDLGSGKQTPGSIRCFEIGKFVPTARKN
jgi:hypothetical protein